MTAQTSKNTCLQDPPGPRPVAPRGNIRLLFMADLSSYAREPFVTDPATPEQIRRLVDDIALSGTDVFGQDVFSQGWVLHFRSDTYEYDQRVQHRRWIPMLDSGINPIEIMIDQAHKCGMRFIASARFGDDHGAPNQCARWFHEHPRYKLKELPPGPLQIPGNTLDFSFAEVRDFHFNALHEIAQRFDIDGIEIAFRSSNFFPYPRSIARQRQPLMTELVRRISRMLREVGRQRDKELLLGVRVQETLDECHDCGLDIPEWIAEDLISYVSPSDSMYSNHNARWDEFCRLTVGTGCRLYPGILPFCSATDARSDTRPWAFTGKPSGTPEHIAFQSRVYLHPMSVENYRAIANNMYGAGADGVSIFNFQEHYTGNLIARFPCDLTILRELKDPADITQKTRVYLFRSMLGGVDYHGAYGMSHTGAIKDDKIVLIRTAPGQWHDYRIRLCEDVSRVARAYAAVRAQGLHPDEGVEIRLNGTVIPSKAIRRTWHPDGRSVNIGRPLPPYSILIFDLPPQTTIDGDNILSLRLLGPRDDKAGDILIDEIDVTAIPKS